MVLPEILKPSQQIPGAVTDTGTGGTPTATSPTTSGQTAYVQSTLLKTGTRSDDVRLLQNALASAGYNVGTIDGIYGSQTAAAVRAYQQALGLSVDGIAGQQTLGSLGLIQGTTAASQPATAAPTGIKPSEQVPGAVTDAGTNVGGPLVTPQPAATQPTSTPVQGLVPGIKPSQQVPGAVTDAGTNVGGPLVTSPGGTQSQPVIGTTPVPGTTVPGAVPGAGTTTPTVSTPTTPSAPTAPAPSEPGKPADIELPSYMQIENPYADMLPGMKFEYNPFQDEEYQRRAAGYEQQIIDMMVGRGGIYSSVTGQALQASLLNLQADMTAQKYQEFIQDRNFTFQMAQFVADENQRMYQRWMEQQRFDLEQQRFAFEQEKELWNRYTWEQEFAFAQAKESFDQKMALAQYNLAAQNQAFNQKMRQLELEQSRAAAQYNDLLRQQLSNERNATNALQTAGQMNAKDIGQFNNMLTKLKSTGKADKDVAKYFGIQVNDSLSWTSTMNAVMKRAAQIDGDTAAINSRAIMLDQDSNFWSGIQDWFDLINARKTEIPATGIQAMAQ